MSKKIMKKSKKGVASFYIVAFSTLILVVIATSFAAVIISEMERTTNDDLSQSAYDSALAGVEDAKLAVYTYQECLNNPSYDPEGCARIKEIIEKPENRNCDQVSRILGREPDGNNGVLVQESSGNNDMYQAYTCVKLSGITDDYKATLTGSNQSKIVRPKFDTDGADTGVAVHAKDVKKVKVSWYSSNNKNSNNGELNYNNFKDNAVTFPSVGKEGSTTETPTPPVLSVGLIQAPNSFTLSSFEKTIGETTNRGLIYLVPVSPDDTNTVGKSGDDLNYIGSDDGNSITKSAFLKSNNKEKTNKPYTVVCDETGDYVCSATIELPNAVNGDRSDENFAIILSLPYGRPDTDVKVEFIYNEKGVGGEIKESTAKLEWVQVEVDSTGRANDLYRRIETRLEEGGSGIIAGMNALEIVGDIKKDVWTICEYDFIINPTCPESL